MFKVNIFKTLNGEFIGRELFNDDSHALSWISIEKAKTGLHYELVDLKQDPEWVEKDIQQKREKEYPSINEVVEALIEAIAENKPQKLNQIQAQRQAIKNKYPIKKS